MTPERSTRLREGLMSIGQNLIYPTLGGYKIICFWQITSAVIGVYHKLIYCLSYILRSISCLFTKIWVGAYLGPEMKIEDARKLVLAT